MVLLALPFQQAERSTFKPKQSSLGRMARYSWLHAVHRDFAVEGDEALTPDSKTDTLAAFIVQERKQGIFVLNSAVA